MVSGVCVLTGTLLCYSTGIAGYLAFRSATAGNILDNFSGPVAGFFKALVVVHLILYTPSHVRSDSVGRPLGEGDRGKTGYECPVRGKKYKKRVARFGP